MPGTGRLQTAPGCGRSLGSARWRPRSEPGQLPRPALSLLGPAACGSAIITAHPAALGLPIPKEFPSGPFRGRSTSFAYICISYASVYTPLSHCHLMKSLRGRRKAGLAQGSLPLILVNHANDRLNIFAQVAHSNGPSPASQNSRKDWAASGERGGTSCLPEATQGSWNHRQPQGWPGVTPSPGREL